MAKPVVLVVDDDEGFQRSMCDVLADDFDAICVGSTLEARAALLRRRVDAIVLDWKLRGETSQVLLHELSKAPNCPPVMVLSGDLDAKTSAERYGIPWLAKPFDAEALMATISKALQQGTRPHRLRP